jgi:CDP-glucose 4,6-dehydratase
MNLINKYKNKKVLITGHTGFKGKWLTIWLAKLGANIMGVSLKSDNLSKITKKYYTTQINEKFFNICDLKKMHQVVNNYKPQYIFHLAAQSIVKKSYEDPILTWNSNLIGTLNILHSLNSLKNKCSAVMITSDKCYKNLEKRSGYKETDILGGDDTYSASKASAEILIKSYFKSFLHKKKNIKIATVRAGNVIGGGDFSQDRIIPDIIRSCQKNKPLQIRNPNSTRPWQHVLEPLYGYLLLGQKLKLDGRINGQSFNFGPSFKKRYSVFYLAKKLILKFISSKKIIIKHNGHIKETKVLILNSQKAYKFLSWKTVLSFDQTLDFTSSWYKNFFDNNKKTISFTISQIDKYLTKILK